MASEMEEEEMIEVFEGLFVGDDNDYLSLEKETIPFTDCDQPIGGWAVVHAAKEPHHRALLGYITKGAPKDDPEYFYAVRENRMFMNLVDAPRSIFFDADLIDRAILFIEEKLADGLEVLVHCNKGESRSPSIALIYGIKNGLVQGETLADCKAKFLKLYPDYNPGDGMRGFVEENFGRYKGMI